MPTMLSERRERLAGPKGIKGIISNRPVFLMAVFASLGGLLYGYNQGMFSQILTMTSFKVMVDYDSISNPQTKGLLTSILELGAWIGALSTGYLADRLGRKYTVDVGCVTFCIGVIVQACATNKSYIYGGRWITGMGVGSLSMVVPLYNAELAPAELRGAMVGLQQLSITFGIMISYWIGYGTNYIGGTGDGQSKAAWIIPIAIQIGPAIVLAVGILFMPQSPRWLMDQGLEDECLATISRVRRLPVDSELVVLEFLEIKAQHMFEVETSREMFPDYQDGSFKSSFLLGLHAYGRLWTNPATRKRTVVAVMIMLFQQWTGINAILYYAPFIFQDLGLTGNTISLLASGVVGIIQFLATIPAVLYIDKAGRKPLLIAGALGMGLCHFIVAGISGAFEDSWDTHSGAGWVAVVFVWIFVLNFAYSWGPAAWIVVSEVFPLGVRAKGISMGASSNWINNFAVGLATPSMLDNMRFGSYIFFGVMSCVGAVYIWLLVPETKDRTLEEMDEIFHDASGQGKRDAERQERIWQELGLLDDTVPTLGREKAAAVHGEGEE
ncbi:general substrate transporter [Dipodascopsis tothii]|uniref:general substrate transporter n=1 Tax=Dipodascopsis tothii TaxID=44089 RepID=UPI0034CD34EB